MPFRILDPKRCGSKFPGNSFLDGMTQLQDLDQANPKKNPGYKFDLTLVDIFKSSSLHYPLTLVMMGGLQTLVMMKGGSKSPPPFLFVKTIEKVIRLCTVLKKKIFDW